MIVHINGWPGVGKLTVARELASLWGARLVDNHTIHDVPGSLCDRNTRAYWDICDQVRAIAYGHLRTLPREQRIVMTKRPASGKQTRG